jgi:uncharacterized protein (TIGR00255 family)
VAHSMTAFARQEIQDDVGTFTWELRSVNHRYLDIAVRLPEELRFIETQVRTEVATQLRRGKVDCFLRYNAPPDAVANLALDGQVTRQLVRLCEEIDALAHNPAPLNSMEVLRWPGVLKIPVFDSEQLKAKALSALGQALDELVETRAREGARLITFVVQRCQEITVLVERVHARMPEVMVRFQDSLRARLAAVQAELDPGRLEQELVLFAQKIDVSEELDRLRAHVAEVEQILQREEPIGRRLDFLMQELNREANTLASKATDVEISQGAVELKVLIEQIREQIQNIE